MSQLKPRATTTAWNGASNSIAAIAGVPRIFAVASTESSSKTEGNGNTEIDYFDDE